MIATHIGPKYRDIKDLEMKDYVEGSETADNLRSTNNNFPLSVKWVDRFNQQHEIILYNNTQSATVLFPCGGKEINWVHSGGKDRTGFDVECTWCEVVFSHVESDWINYHGIRVKFRGYKSCKTGTYTVDWDRAKKGLEAAKDAIEIGGKVAAVL